MTRRDFELIATVIRDEPERFRSQAAHAAFASAMAAALAATNERFDRERFVAACQPGWTVGTRHATPWERVATAR